MTSFSHKHSCLEISPWWKYTYLHCLSISQSAWFCAVFQGLTQTPPLHVPYFLLSLLTYPVLLNILFHLSLSMGTWNVCHPHAMFLSYRHISLSASHNILYNNFSLFDEYMKNEYYNWKLSYRLLDSNFSIDGKWSVWRS